MADPLLLPCVFHIGFAGPRKLFTPADGDPAALAVDLQHKLAERIDQLRCDHRLGETYFLCGLSQVAIGADTVFTRVCRDAGITHRVLLPQPPDEYFSAGGSEGPDFTPEQQDEARQLLASPHVVEVRVVADSNDRKTRFEQTNFEIARLSDVVVCLTRDPADGRPGGTRDLMAQARARRTRVLELAVGVANGRVELRDTWHDFEAGGGEPVVPRLPEELAAVRMPGTPGRPPACDAFLSALKTFSSQRARLQKWLFRSAALLIVASHIAATVMATVFVVKHRHEPAGRSPAPDRAGPPATHPDPAHAAPAGLPDRGPAPKGDPADPPATHPDPAHAAPAGLPDRGPAPEGDPADPPATHPDPAHGTPAWLLGLLGLELVLLAGGAGIHWAVHHREWSRTWAVARITAEVARSAGAFAGWHAHLSYLFQLPLPLRLRPVLRTLNVLHLQSTRPPGNWQAWQPLRDAGWEKVRAAYVTRRLTDPKSGQIAYYQLALDRAALYVRAARASFWLLATAAMAAVVAKLSYYAGWVHLPEPCPGLLSVVTVAAPVLAVGALTLAAAMDYFAQKHIYSEMVAALRAQVGLLNEAKSAHEFERLAFETEARLLGETANWYFRRSFAEVT